jgi:hypothetical protein
MASRTLSVTITGDATGAQRAMASVSDGADSLSSKFTSVGQKLMSAGAKMTVGLTLPLGLLGKAAFDAASDLEESISKVNVVFEDSAPIIQKWSRDAAENLGMSRQAALEAAGTFGNLFRALGVGIKPATDMSKKLVGLAADLASFNNVDPTEALDALRSGLVGEVEPLRRFGVSLSAARVEAKAMEMGLADASGELTDSAKVAARYAIIMEDTALAQGDFARTADGAANKQRILKAQFQDTIAQLGKALLPLFQELASVLQVVAEWFTNLSPQMQKVVVVAGLLLAVVGPLTTAIGALATVIGVLISPITLVVLGIAAMIAAAYLLWTNWDTIWTWIKEHPAIAVIVAILATPVAAFFTIVGGLKWLYENWDSIWSEIQAITDAVVGAITGAWNFMGDVISGVYNAVIAPVLGAIGFAIGLVRSVIEDFVRVWSEVWSAIGAVIGPIANGIVNTLGTIVSVIREIIGAARTAADALSKIGDIGGKISNPGGKGEFGGIFGAAGGIVTRPTMAMIGEAGPEAVIPLHSAPGASPLPRGFGGGGQIVIPVVIDGREVARAVWREDDERDRRRGR